MHVHSLIRSERIRKGVQLGIVPSLVASVHQHGARNLIRTVGFAESVTLLSAMIVLQLSLILTRFKFDLQVSA